MKYLEETDLDKNNYSVTDRFLRRGRLMERKEMLEHSNMAGYDAYILGSFPECL